MTKRQAYKIVSKFFQEQLEKKNVRANQKFSFGFIEDLVKLVQNAKLTQ